MKGLADKINKLTGMPTVTVSQKELAGEMRFVITVNGKVTVKLDEDNCISFLDGFYSCLMMNENIKF